MLTKGVPKGGPVTQVIRARFDSKRDSELVPADIHQGSEIMKETVEKGSSGSNIGKKRAFGSEATRRTSRDYRCLGLPRKWSLGQARVTARAERG